MFRLMCVCSATARMCHPMYQKAFNKQITFYHFNGTLARRPVHVTTLPSRGRGPVCLMNYLSQTFPTFHRFKASDFRLRENDFELIRLELL